MKQLFIFGNVSNPEFECCINTYINQLTGCFKNSGLSLNVVYLRAENKEFEIKTENETTYFFFPAFAKNTRQNTEIQYEHYYRNIFYILNDYIDKEHSPVFYLNYCQYDTLSSQLRKKYPASKIITTIHKLSWSLSGKEIKDIRTLIHKEEQEIQEKQEELMRIYFQKEKEEFAAIDKIICVTELTYNLLKEEYNLEADRIALIPYGLPENSTAPSIKKRQDIREELSFQPEEKIILYLQKLTDNAGELQLLQSFQEILQQIPECRLIIVGQSNPEFCDKKLRGAWSKINYTGKIDKTRLTELYQISDLGILPYFHEEGSYTAIGMMLNGLPFLSTDCYGLKEIFKSHKAETFKIKTKRDNKEIEIDTNDLKEKAINILTQKQNNQHIHNTLRQEYLNHYTLDSMNEKTQSFLKNDLNTTARKRKNE